MMAHIQQSGLVRLTTRYYKAVRAGWRAARAGWQTAREKQYPEHDRSTTAGRTSGGTFSRYLKNHDGQSLIRPLNSAMMPHEQIKKYERELLAALNVEEQPETRNIAISGAIGAGKSAFIHAFTERNPQFKYTRFFLPALSEINTPITPDSNENEKVVLEQLLCSITGELPDDIKAQQPKTRGWRKVIGVILALLTSYSIATLGYLSGSMGIDQSTAVKALHLYLPDPMLAFAKKYAPLLAELSLFLVATLLIMYLFTGLLKTGQRKRLTRLESSADRSDVSNYLHQINHAFNHSRYDIVIVENLTSPCQRAALETLYCVNGYLNGSGHIKQPIYFVYVLADEILTASERTRFFDLIIPIIPAPNAENVGPELYKQLKTINSREMDKALIYNVASAIDDMKLMTNIVNEFHIYLDQLSPDYKALNKNKLFAMVVIKNLYPKEHAELTDDMGLFWTVFNDNKLSGKTVAETLQQGFMADSVLRELTEERFAPLLYLLMNGYFAEDYRDYLFYFYPDTTPNEHHLASWQPVTPHPLEYQAINFSRKSSNLNHREYLNGYLPNDFQVATRWQISESPEVWRYHELEVNEYSPPGSNLKIDRDISEIDEQLYLQMKEGLVADFKQTVNLPESFQHHLTPSDLTNGQGPIKTVVDYPLENPSAKYHGHSSDTVQAMLIAGVLPMLISGNHDNLSKAIIHSIATLTDIHPIIRLVNDQPDIWTWLKKHQVKFDRLSLRHCTQRIAFRIIEDSMYQLNSHMMGLLLAFTTEEQPTALAPISYSALCSCRHQRLIRQIHENLNEFVTNVLLVQPGLKEDQSYLVELLKAPVLKMDDKIQLIKQSGQKQTSIRDTFNLLMALIHNNEIHDATLNQLLSAFPDFYLEHLNLTYISPSRIEIISQHPKCRFSFKSLEWLAKSENHFKADTTFYYLLRFWNEYKTNAVSTAQLTVNTIVKLLSSSEINIDDKLWLCNLLNNENEIDGRILAAMLAPITSQPAESFTMKIRFSRLETLMATARTLPEKIRLLSQQVKYLSQRELLTLLSQLDIDGAGQLMKENKQFSLSGTQENIELINALK